MRTIVQCPTCKAVKFLTVEGKKTFWQPLTETEFIAFEIVQSSNTLQILVGEIYAEHILCDCCNHAIEN